MSVFEIRKGFLSRRFRWVLIADNGEPVAVSEHFTTKQAARHSIAATRQAAAHAVVDDLTVKR